MIFESWDAESLDVTEPSGDPGKRRKRRRRRRGGGEGDDRPSEGEPRDFREPQDAAPPRGDGARPRGRRLVREDADAPGVAIPSSGKMSSETILFGWLTRAGGPHFKEISRRIR